MYYLVVLLFVSSFIVNIKLSLEIKNSFILYFNFLFFLYYFVGFMVNKDLLNSYIFYVFQSLLQYILFNFAFFGIELISISTKIKSINCEVTSGSDDELFTGVFFLLMVVYVLFLYYFNGIPLFSYNPYLSRVKLYKGFNKFVWYVIPSFVVTMFLKMRDKNLTLSYIFFFLTIIFLSLSSFGSNVASPIILLMFYFINKYKFNFKSFLSENLKFAILLLIISVLLLVVVINLRGGPSLFNRLFLNNSENYISIIENFKPGELNFTYFTDIKSLIRDNVISFAELATFRITNYRVKNLVMTPTIFAEFYVNFSFVGSILSAMFFGAFTACVILVFKFFFCSKYKISRILLLHFELVLAGIISQGFGQILKFLIPFLVILILFKIYLIFSNTFKKAVYSKAKIKLE